MNKKGITIDFIGIGASKAGSTYIWKCLEEHPQICGPKGYKEIAFFSAAYKKGMTWYESLFKTCNTGKIKGEFTPGYLACSKCSQRIKDNFPEVKIIAILRNPVDRAFSQYRADKKADLQCARLSFEEALKTKNKFTNQGLYFQHLKRYFDIFPRDNIKILIFEEVKKEPLKYIQEVYDFLGVDGAYEPKTIDKKVNKSREFRFQGLHIMLCNMFKKLKINRLFVKLRLTWLTKAFKKLNTKKTETPKIKPETRQYLYNKFKDDINNLENLINKDLSIWKQ